MAESKKQPAKRPDGRVCIHRSAGLPKPMVFYGKSKAEAERKYQQSVLDSQFHNALMHMSHNSLIKYIYTTLSSLMDIYRERVLEKTWRLDKNALTRAGHQAICQALKDRDEAAAAAAVRDHLTLTGPYREFLGEQNADVENRP